MPRARRIEYPGAFYHVFNRGRNRENIFHDESDFRLFLEIIRKTSIKFEFIIHAYCLMDNHYHLLIETPEGNLNQIMHNIGSMYVQNYNRSKGVDGSLFKGRYKSILVDKDSYLFELTRYIHRNPLGIVKDLRRYPWSSYRSYLGLSEVPSWLNKEQTLEMIGLKNNVEGYITFVEEDRFNDKGVYSGRKVLPGILGSDKFKSSFKK